MEQILIILFATISIIILHEIGHVILILLLNFRERKPIHFQLSITKVEVIHEAFSKKWMNLIIAMSGVLFPFLFMLFIKSIFNTPFVNILFVLSIFNFMFILPIFPDGKNVLTLLEKRDIK